MKARPRKLRMVKRQYSMTETDHTWLAREAARRGVSSSELVRRIVAAARAVQQ